MPRIRRNLRTLERRAGRFDVIIGQTWMFGAPGEGQYGAFVPRDLRDHPAPKLLNLLQVDPYSIPGYIYESCIWCVRFTTFPCARVNFAICAARSLRERRML